MRQRDIVLVCVLLGAIVVGMFTYTYLERQQVSVPAPVEEVPPVVPSYVTRIDAKHFFIDGVHTIVGEIMMPTPCDLLTYEATVAESFPEQITYNFGVINNSDTCAQVVTPQRFLVNANASSGATHQATWNGQLVELNLVEAAAGETPEAFELYIKG